MKTRAFCFRLIATSAALLLALGCGEVAVRILGIGHPKNDLGVQPHALWHHWHRPGYAFDYHVVAEGYTEPIHFNRFGMRDSREVRIKKKPGVFRVAVLGDSFVEALQVGEAEGICRQLEGQLHERLGRPVEVLNFGCSGFSSTLELVLLRESVLRFSPDLVVCLHHFSDITEDWRVSPRARVEDGQVMAVPMSLAPGTQLIRDIFGSSQLYRLTRGVLDGARRHRTASPDNSLQETFDAIVHEPYTAKDEAAWAYSLNAVKDMAELARGNDIPFLVAIVPIGTQVEPAEAGYAKELGFAYLAGGERLECLAYQNKVTGFCAENDIDCLDLLEAFRAANPEGTPRFYLPRDQHWTAAGHELAAQCVAEALARRLAR
jgi:hypothetical protein